jgi:hypothetical protein
MLLLLLLLLQMRKAANRMNFDFNKAEDEYIDGDEVVGLGTINKEGSGRLRLVASQQKVGCARGAGKCSGGEVAYQPAAGGLCSKTCVSVLEGMNSGRPCNICLPVGLLCDIHVCTYSRIHVFMCSFMSAGQAERQAGEEVPQQADSIRHSHQRAEQHTGLYTSAGEPGSGVSFLGGGTPGAW